MGSAEFATELVSTEKVPTNAAHKALPNQHSCFPYRTTFDIKLKWIQLMVCKICLLLPPNFSSYERSAETWTIYAGMFVRCFSMPWLWQWAVLWLDGALAMWYMRTAIRVAIVALYRDICESSGSDYNVHICLRLWGRIISAVGHVGILGFEYWNH